MEDLSKQYKTIADDFIMNWLKQNGYRPKPTEKYIKGLQKRLKQKGLRLCFNSTIKYESPKQEQNGFTMKGTIIPSAWFEKLNETN